MRIDFKKINEIELNLLNMKNYQCTGIPEIICTLKFI